MVRFLSREWGENFNPQGSREPRRKEIAICTIHTEFQSTRLSRASTPPTDSDLKRRFYFNPQGSREPRPSKYVEKSTLENFNPQGSREPRQRWLFRLAGYRHISIHKALASLDQEAPLDENNQDISIHKALASLDVHLLADQAGRVYFNPQGSREPRRQTLDDLKTSIVISIHKALASLDGKNAQLFLHLCHIYMLHIIHLLQIVYQVEISSRNLIVFSGQL